jgi:hypothetical protein
LLLALLFVLIELRLKIARDIRAATAPTALCSFFGRKNSIAVLILLSLLVLAILLFL